MEAGDSCVAYLKRAVDKLKAKLAEPRVIIVSVGIDRKNDCIRLLFPDTVTPIPEVFYLSDDSRPEDKARWEELRKLRSSEFTIEI